MSTDLNIYMKKAVEAHAAGRISEAEILYKAILDVQPSHASTNFNIGLLCANANDHAAALLYFRKAVRHAPENLQYWPPFIRCLLALDEIDEAVTSLRKAHARGLKGEAHAKVDESIRIRQIALFLRKGKPREALRRAVESVGAYPCSAPLRNLYGSALANLGDWDKAIVAFQEAIALDPNAHQAFNNLGIAQREKGAFDQAINSFANCTRIRPGYPDAYRNLGALYCGLGRFHEAFLTYRDAVENNAADEDTYRNLSFALSNLTFSRPTPVAAEIICRLLDMRTAASPEAIAIAAVSLLKCDPTIRRGLSASSEPQPADLLDIIVELSGIPLLLRLMSACPIPDLEFEALFTNLRRWLLLNADRLPQRTDALGFQQALALQSDQTEYIYAETAAETEAVTALEAVLNGRPREAAALDAAAVACLASYRPLHRYAWSRSHPAPAGLEALYARQVSDHRLMREFTSRLPVLRRIEDSTSLQVKEQYEENPYPRWSSTSIPRVPFTIRELTGSLKLKMTDDRINAIGSPEILVAGCGTGKQAINLAASISNAHVVAVDLSAASIGYAKLKTREYGLTNIDFYQGDIKDLGLLDRKFDILQCGGVLHHMADPLAGWKKISEALKPGGLMNIALYSALARTDIAKIRSDNDAAEAMRSPDGLTEFRKRVIANRDRYPHCIMASSEFYNRSMFRDLFLHVQEVCFTIAEIGEALRDLGLAFSGFVLDDNTRTKFASINAAPDDPYDLGKWETFEGAYPETFREMYQFWCQKDA